MSVRPGLAAAAFLALCACPASHKLGPGPEAVLREPAAGGEAEGVAGVVHVVRRGQTLYRIARAYGVEPGQLMEANGIEDPRALAVGQELFVPGATRELEVEEAPGLLPRKPAPGDTPLAPAQPARLEREEERPLPGQEPSHPVLAWPLRGVLYGRFGPRGAGRHDGIDIAAPEGTVIAAAAEGTVLFVGEQSGYGRVVMLRHAGDLVTIYAHASAALVREGERVARGQPVARVGQTGRTTGPHLHFEVRQGVRPRNPLLYLP